MSSAISAPSPGADSVILDGDRPPLPPDFIGVDWADKAHAICVIDPERPTPQPSTLEHKSAVIVAWARAWQPKYPNRELRPIIESSRGALIHALIEVGGFTIYPINPPASHPLSRSPLPHRSQERPDRCPAARPVPAASSRRAAPPPARLTAHAPLGRTHSVATATRRATPANYLATSQLAPELFPADPRTVRRPRSEPRHPFAAALALAARTETSQSVTAQDLPQGTRRPQRDPPRRTLRTHSRGRRPDS